MTVIPRRPALRKGVAAVWVLVVLAVISTITAAAIGQFAAARRQVDEHRNRLEADWLARAGYELAAAKILADPKGYTSETVKPIPGGEVKITVRRDSGENGAYRIESEARYPAGERGMVVRTERRALKRIEGPQGVRIESARGER